MNGPTIEDIWNAIYHLLSGGVYSSVHVVIVVWDSRELGTDLAGTYGEVVCKRNAVPIYHANPIQILPDDDMLAVFNTFIMGYLFAGYSFVIRVANSSS